LLMANYIVIVKGMTIKNANQGNMIARTGYTSQVGLTWIWLKRKSWLLPVGCNW